MYRASWLLNELRNEAFEKQKNNRKYPLYRAGDSIEIEVSLSSIYLHCNPY